MQVRIKTDLFAQTSPYGMRFSPKKNQLIPAGTEGEFLGEDGEENVYVRIGKYVSIVDASLLETIENDFDVPMISTISTATH